MEAESLIRPLRDSEVQELPPDGSICPQLHSLPAGSSLSNIQSRFLGEIYGLIRPYVKDEAIIARFAMYRFRGTMTPQGNEIFVITLGEKAIARKVHTEVRAQCEQVVRNHVPNATLRIWQLTIIPLGAGAPPYLPECNAHTSLKFERVVKMGFSVGPTRSTEAVGTICGFVTLTDSETDKPEPGQFALTCHHVISPVDPKPVKEHQIGALCPSKGDRQSTETLYQSKRDEALRIFHGNPRVTGRSDDNLSDKELAMKAESGHQPSQRMLDMRNLVRQEQSDIAEGYEKDLDKLYNFYNGLGDVMASSGIAFLPSQKQGGLDSCLDWAIIKLTDCRVGVNRLDRSKKLPSSEWGDLRALMAYQRESNEMEGLQVRKCGRTSGWSTGVVSSEKVHWSHWTGAEVSDRAIRNPNKEYFLNFSAAGDSGAAIVDDQDCCIGMLIAGSKERGTGEDITFYVGWDEIVRDVLTKTGKVMEWQGQKEMGEPAPAPDGRLTEFGPFLTK